MCGDPVSQNVSLRSAAREKRDFTCKVKQTWLELLINFDAWAISSRIIIYDLCHKLTQNVQEVLKGTIVFQRTHPVLSAMCGIIEKITPLLFLDLKKFQYQVWLYFCDFDMFYQFIPYFHNEELLQDIHHWNLHNFHKKVRDSSQKTLQPNHNLFLTPLCFQANHNLLQTTAQLAKFY